MRGDNPTFSAGSSCKEFCFTKPPQMTAESSIKERWLWAGKHREHILWWWWWCCRGRKGGKMKGYREKMPQRRLWRCSNALCTRWWRSQTERHGMIYKTGGWCKRRRSQRTARPPQCELWTPLFSEIKKGRGKKEFRYFLANQTADRCEHLPGRLRRHTFPDSWASRQREQLYWDEGSPAVWPHPASAQTCTWRKWWPILPKTDKFIKLKWNKIKK